MDEIELLARHVSETEFEGLTEPVRHITKIFIMDLLGVAIAGSSAPGCEAVVNQLKAWGGVPNCTVIGYDVRLPSIHAAFANSTSAHALDFDDTHLAGGVHATASIIPAALAVAEETGGIGGKRVITAIALGVDIAARLGLAFKRNLHDGFLPSTMFCGFGAVGAVAKILGLDPAQIRNAFGIFYSQMSGNRQGLLDGALTKRIQPAFAAMQAIYAAHFAKSGITGAQNVISGKYGLAALYTAGDMERDALSRELGERFEISNLGIKIYPCCRGAHPSIEGALRIQKREGIDPVAIEAVDISVSPFTFDLVGSPFQIRENPQVDAQFSISYAVAVALIRKAVGLSDFTKDVVVNDRAVHDLAARIRVKADVKIEPDNPDSALAVIRVRCKDGSEFLESVSSVKGDPQDPLTTEECVEKFRGCIAFAQKDYSPEAVEGLVSSLLDLENVQDFRDVWGRLQ